MERRDSDQDYIVPSTDLEFLTVYCRDNVFGRKIEKPRQAARRKLLDSHAMAYALSKFAALYPGHTFIDANIARPNNPGFDILMDESIRIQVKGRCWKEMIDFAVPSLSSRKGWESDIWVCVDFAGLIDARFGKYEDVQEMAPTGEIDMYVAPTHHLRKLTEQHLSHQKRPRLLALKPGARASRKTSMPKLLKYKNQFGILEEYAEVRTA